MSFFNTFLFFSLICVSLHTSSYAIWTWKKKNRFGALMVFLLALVEIGLPLYSVFFKD